MKLLMISGDRSVLQGKKGAFWYTLEEFRKHWERIDIICPWAEMATGNRQQTSFFENVFFHPSPHGLWYQPFWISKKGQELIAQQHHDVMTVHEYPPFYNGIGARMLAKKVRVPRVLEVHHIVGYPTPASATERMGLTMSRQYLSTAIRKTEAARVVNQGTKQTLIRWGAPAEKIHVVPSFYLDAATLRPDQTIQKQCDIAFCGRLAANKGLMEVLRAVESLPSVRLIVIGDGPERARAESFVSQKKMTDRVRFVGWLPLQEDVIRTIQSAKILVMNSKSEGGPRVVFEAMACGMPVIATNVGAVPDVIRDGENGVLTTGEPEDLSKKIQMLLSDDNLRTRIGKEAEKVTEKFERKKLIAEYAEFLKTYTRR